MFNTIDHQQYIQNLRHRLKLNKLDKPIKNADKQSCRYELTYMWYNAAGGVQGVEYLYYPTKEINPILPELLSGRKTLFDFFRLFP